MPTDLTGTPTSLGIGTYNVDVDAPSGLGFNEAMAQIDALIGARVATPSGIAAGEGIVWNGTGWARSSVTRFGESSLGSGTADVSKTLHGDGTWLSGEIGYDEMVTTINVTGLSSASPTVIIAGSAYTFDGNPVIAEFNGVVRAPSAAAGNSTSIGLFEGATLINVMNLVNPGTTLFQEPMFWRLRFTPSAGAHTYSIKAWATNVTGTPLVTATAVGSGGATPTYLRFSRAST